LAKRSCAIRLLDLNDASSWDGEELRNFSLAEPSTVPLRGIWSEDVERFYLSFATGALAAFRWDAEAVSLGWSSRGASGSSVDQEVQDALNIADGRVQTHIDLDLLLTTVSAGDVLHVDTRLRGGHPT